MDYGASLHLAKLTPEFAKLQAILGRKLKDTASWAPYDRLVSLHGWKRILRAAEQADPDKRWASDLEKLCLQFQREQDQAEVEARERERIAALPKPTNGKERAALFASIRAKVGA